MKLRAYFLILGISILWFGAAARAEEVGRSERAKAVIGGKGQHVLLLNVHGFEYLQRNKISVPRTALIYDMDGTVIDMKRLKIPSEAYIEYKRDDENTPQVYRVEVIGYEDNATTLFTELHSSKKELPQ